MWPQNPQKNNGAPISVIKIVISSVRRREGGSAKILQKSNGTP